jgi:hypothetical protein
MPEHSTSLLTIGPQFCSPLMQVAASLLNKSSCLAPTLGVTKFIIITDLIWVTLCRAT